MKTHQILQEKEGQGRAIHGEVANSVLGLCRASSSLNSLVHTTSKCIMLLQNTVVAEGSQMKFPSLLTDTVILPHDSYYPHTLCATMLLLGVVSPGISCLSTMYLRPCTWHYSPFQTTDEAFLRKPFLMWWWGGSWATLLGLTGHLDLGVMYHWDMSQSCFIGNLEKWGFVHYSSFLWTYSMLIRVINTTVTHTSISY